MMDLLTGSWSLVLTLAGGLALPLVLLAVGKVPLAYNLRNLALRRTTTLLAGLAFTLVVLLLMLMLAFVNGMDRLTEASGHPGNVIVLSQGVTDELLSYLPVADTGEIGLQPGIVRD